MGSNDTDSSPSLFKVTPLVVYPSSPQLGTSTAPENSAVSPTAPPASAINSPNVTLPSTFPAQTDVSGPPSGITVPPTMISVTDISHSEPSTCIAVATLATSTTQPSFHMLNPSQPPSAPLSPPESISVSTTPASAENTNAHLSIENTNGRENDNNANITTPHRRETISHRSDASVQVRTPLARRWDRILTIYTLVVVIVSVAVIASTYSSKKESNGEAAQRWSQTFFLVVWLITYAIIAVIRILACLILHSVPSHRIRRTPRRIILWCLRCLHLAFFVWSIVGIVWLRLHGSGASALIRSIVVTVIAIELVVLFASIVLAVIIFVFALRPAISERQLCQGATKEALSELPVTTYDSEKCLAQSCSICLCDYDTDDNLRQLPCSSGAHMFHVACVDEWLMRRRSCPICREDPFGPKQGSIQQAQQTQQTSSRTNPTRIASTV